MNFKELLEKKKVNGYLVSVNTGIPYMTINDLMNGKTSIQNVTLKHAIKIADYLNISVEKLAKLDNPKFIEFRYFRNNTLHYLKSLGAEPFIKKIINAKEIDYYYKNDGKKYAYYLLALLDYLCRYNNLPKYQDRYNKIRKEKLDKPLFVGGDIFKFDTVEEAEKEFNITVIPEFKKYNIIEGNVFNVV